MNGITIQDRLSFNIELAKNAKCSNKKREFAHQAFGAVEIAVEFGLITFAEFETYTKEIIDIL